RLSYSAISRQRGLAGKLLEPGEDGRRRRARRIEMTGGERHIAIERVGRRLGKGVIGTERRPVGVAGEIEQGRTELRRVRWDDADGIGAEEARIIARPCADRNRRAD